MRNKCASSGQASARILLYISILIRQRGDISERPRYRVFGPHARREPRHTVHNPSSIDKIGQTADFSIAALTSRAAQNPEPPRVPKPLRRPGVPTPAPCQLKRLMWLGLPVAASARCRRLPVDGFTAKAAAKMAPIFLKRVLKITSNIIWPVIPHYHDCPAATTRLFPVNNGGDRRKNPR